MAFRSSDNKTQQNGHGNECFVCKRTCYNTCSRCGEFYCSKQCQTNDWREHKYYCFEMPELIMKSSPNNGQQFNDSPKFQSDNRRVVQNLRRSQPVQSNSSDSETPPKESQHSGRNQNTFKPDEQIEPSPQPGAFNFADYPKDNDDVVITHIRFANSFYVRTCSSEDEFKKNAKDYDDYGRGANRLRSLPRKNDIVLVRYEGKFHRAVVLNAEAEDHIEIALADIGRKIHKPIHEMRQISDELKSRKRFNFIVTLDHMQKKLNSEEFAKLREFQKNQTVFQVQYNGNDWKSAEKFKLLKKDSGLPIERAVLENEPVRLNGNDAKIDNIAKPAEADRSRPVETSTSEAESNNGTDAVGTTSVTSSDDGPTRTSDATDEINESHQPICCDDLATETLPEVTDLSILDNSFINLRYVLAVASVNVEKFWNLHTKVNEWGDRHHEIYEPKLDELCVVNVLEEWHRAIRNVSGFSLIDFGISEKVERSKVRRFPEELKDPLYTFVCYVDGLTPDMVNDKKKVEELKELLSLDNHPDCVCVKSGDDPMEYRVTFPKLSNFFK